MSIIQGSSISASSTESGSAGFYDYPIEQSLRFDGTSSYLTRTATAGNRGIYTLSMWLKFAIPSAVNTGDVTLFAQGDGTNDTQMLVQGTADKFWFLDRNGTTSYYQAPGHINDTSSWYHVVYEINTSNSTNNSDPSASTDVVRVHINGIPQALSMYPGGTDVIGSGHNTQINHTSYSTVYISRNPWGSSGYFSGYMAEVNFIDGQALDASYFGETKQDIWIPKTFDGTSSTGGSTVSTDYGTNGFLLDFSSISGSTINDTAPLSGNHLTNNDWTATGF